MSYDNPIGISHLRNCNHHNSDHNLTRMCEELYYIHSNKKTGRQEKKEKWEGKKTQYLMHGNCSERLMTLVVFRRSIARSSENPGIICRKASWSSEPYYIDVKRHNPSL